MRDSNNHLLENHEKVVFDSMKKETIQSEMIFPLNWLLSKIIEPTHKFAIKDFDRKFQTAELEAMQVECECNYTQNALVAMHSDSILWA